MTASQRWKQKKSGNIESTSGDREAVLKLTGLADKVLSKYGNMDVYQETYESINFKVRLKVDISIETGPVKVINLGPVFKSCLKIINFTSS